MTLNCGASRNIAALSINVSKISRNDAVDDHRKAARQERFIQKRRQEIEDIDRAQKASKKISDAHMNTRGKISGKPFISYGDVKMEAPKCSFFRALFSLHWLGLGK